MPRRKKDQPKRRHSFGTVSQPKDRKVWEARYKRWGKPYRLPGTFATEAQARAALRREKEYIDSLKSPADFIPPQQRHQQALAEREREGLTVGLWMQQWLELIAADVKPSTLESHTRIVNSAILKAPGKMGELRDVPLVNLARADIVAWVDELKKRWPSSRTSKNAYSRFHTAMQAAVARDLIPHNPCAGIKNSWPKSQRKELPELEVMQGILDHMSDRYKIVTALTFFHGMRIGEVLALRRKDVELIPGGWVVHVRGNSYRKPGAGMIRMDSPKTDAGVRDVPVFEQFGDLIRHHLDTYVGADPDSMVCVTASGEVVMDTSYRSRLATAKKAAGHEGVKITPHYGRVWLITRLVESGMTIPGIGEILGQTDLKTITEIYMRTSEAKKREALKRAGQIFG